MEIKQLRSFIAVARLLNFTEASKQLFLAQSAISQHIADLEREIGVKLFVRNKRSVKLTAAGTFFLPEAVETIKRAEMAVQRARQTDSGLIGSVRVGFINSAVRMFLPRVMRKFRQQFPNVEIHLEQLTLAAITTAVRNGDLDLGFTLSMGLNKIPGIVWEKIYTDYTSVVVHSEHPLADKTCINIASLAEEPFIVMSRHEAPEGFDHVLKLYADHGFSPRIVEYPPLMETVLFLVESGSGVAIVPGFAKIYGNSDLRFIDIEGNAGTYDVGMIWRKVNNNPSLPILIEAISKELPEIIHTL